MNNLVLDNKFITSINFLDNILFIDSFIDNKKIYNVLVDYLKRDNHYILKLNIFDGEENIVDTECMLASKKNGSIVINDIINLVTKKYNNDIIIDVKEMDEFNNCIKFGRRKYNSNKK